MHRPLIHCLVLCTCSTLSWAQDAPVTPTREQILLEGRLPEEHYSPPVFNAGKNIAPSVYPASELWRSREGWVSLNMMIDTTGKPYELHVADSSGNPVLEAAAIKAVEKYQFTPATLNGKPVDAGISDFKFKFLLEDIEKGAHRDFVLQYKAFTTAINAKDRSDAEAKLKAMKVHNLYEDAFYNYARYTFARFWGTEWQQLEALQRSIAYERNAKYLPAEMFKSAVLQLFILQIRYSDFGGALKTYALLDKTSKSDLGVASAYADIRNLQYDNRSFSLRSELSGGGDRFINLLKRHFSVLVTDGRLADIKLYCDAKFVLIHYERDLDYTIPAEYGACNLQLIGDPGTQFTLIQS